jgi:hypothetical protein
MVVMMQKQRGKGSGRTKLAAERKLVWIVVTHLIWIWICDASSALRSSLNHFDHQLYNKQEAIFSASNPNISNCQNTKSASWWLPTSRSNADITWLAIA